ncbi:hypothetical protein, conserved [Trypanosoma brucei gambiense DAL972]|uniref:Uncharacterized protein n=2 Tax=Trypanosoma brucei TaxID=5691 RepID=D0A568_TRYB9|nr:hypothetical protein, conserved [Trypanosoma brucei gambiense DAL972]RHW68944.1 hypothetical protein DPX39_100131900 [Trypanosoma brucei equiperdum]CBH16412.1 hypothetical protein, conserved [Trypanosoma brucei gambiense DAL972]|eukprot:XP_011778676.1 hypothetical protein, conserved [Trypanosoma brucei gambiense DAL972]
MGQALTGVSCIYFSRISARCAASDGVCVRSVSYRPRWGYSFPFRSKGFRDFIYANDDGVFATAYTYRNDETGITVTLIPLRHFAHPQFFHQVDLLCCQHQSVLMEGRTPMSGAPYSTIVPPRELSAVVRPKEHEDSEGWEPRETELFWQPFSWGVSNSPNFTVVHAADKYDYERIPWWFSLRFNLPIVGSLGREKHCINMISHLKTQGYKSFAIPWGASHMPIFNEILIDNGFENVGMCSLVVVRRCDGDISAGEHERMYRLQKRRDNMGTIGWLIATVCSLTVLRSFVTVDYTKG